MGTIFTILTAIRLTFGRMKNKSDFEHAMMTIHQFSERTGLPPSTLRFYDKHKLLEPLGRLDNGYRIYEESQISAALMIHSLRSADIRIEDIRRYLHAKEKDKKLLIDKWRSEIHSKLTALGIAKQYIQAIDTEDDHIHLLRWDEARTFLWTRHESQESADSLRRRLIHECDRLLPQNANRHSGIYLRNIGTNKGRAYGELGVRLHHDLNPTTLASNMVIEVLPPTLFVAFDSLSVNAFSCFQFLHIIQRFHLVPIGNHLEKYMNSHHHHVQIMVPVSH